MTKSNHQMTGEEPGDVRGILDQCAAVFEAPPKKVPTPHVSDGPLLGNGDVGVVLSGPPEDLRFHLGKNDFWTADRRRLRGGPTVLTLGGVILHAPALNGASYHVTQDIARAELRGEFAGRNASLELTAWMPREPNLLVCKLRNIGKNPLEMNIRQWAGDPQTSFPDHAGQKVLLGHAECWLTPVLDQFCGGIREARLFDGCLTPEEIHRQYDNHGQRLRALHEFTELGTHDDPFPLAATVPPLGGRELTLCAWVCPSADVALRAGRKAAQPHGFTLNRHADTQYIMAKGEAFSLQLVERRVVMTVGRLCAAAEPLLPAGQWSHIACSFDGRHFYFYLNGAIVGVLAADHVTQGAAESLLWFTRQADPDHPDGISAAVATRMIESGAVVHDGTLTIILQPNQEYHLVTAVVSGKGDDDVSGAACNLAARCTKSTLEDWRSAHRHWWRKYWAQSSIDVGDPLLHRYYYGAYYILGCCCGAPTQAPPGLFGNWITTDAPMWRGDYHLNYNYQAPWWGAFGGNRIELAESYDLPILDFIPQGKALAHASGQSGVLYPVGIGPGGISSDPSFWGQKSNAAYAAVNMIMRWKATRDVAYLEKVYPFIRMVGDFWQSYLRLENDRYVIHGDSIHEGSGEDVNPSLSLALVRMIFVFLQEASTLLGRDVNQHQRWRHITEHLNAIPVFDRHGKKVFRLTEIGMAWAEGNTLELQHVYPGGSMGLGSSSALLEIAHETIRQKAVWDEGNSFPTFFTQAARVGYDPAVILTKLKEQLRSAHALPNLFMAYFGGGIETCGGITSALQEMLLQSHDGVIRLFPCWPVDCPASFRDLRADGAFLVSASRSAVRVDRVMIKSLKGGTCRVANPWQSSGQTLHVIESGTAGRPCCKGQNIATWDTHAGTVYELTSQL